MAGVEGFTEFGGGGVMPNTVFPKGAEALTAEDQLRLDSLTGQTEDSQAPLDPWHWNGGTYDPQVIEDIKEARRERLARGQELRRAEAARYRESPY